jgi:hypothetical protein
VKCGLTVDEHVVAHVLYNIAAITSVLTAVTAVAAPNRLKVYKEGVGVWH